MERQARHLKETYNADIWLLQTGHMEISSSVIRNLCKENKSIRYLVPEAVYEYIIQNKLYKNDMNNEIEKS